MLTYDAEGDPRIGIFLVAFALAAVTALVLSWVTSMVAGPFALVKLRGKSDTLRVYTSIVLPLSLAVGLVFAIAVPVEYGSDCDFNKAVVPLVTAPIYWLGDPSEARVSYVDSVHSCGP